MVEIAIAQINPTMGDLSRNAQKIKTFWQDLDQQGANLIIFPELSICGYPPEDLVFKPVFLDEIEKQVRNLCKETKNLKSAALIGSPWREDGKIYNAALWIKSGEIKHVIKKHHLPNFSVFDEIRTFSSASLKSLKPIDAFGEKLGILICRDMWDESVAHHLKSQGATQLIVINGSPFKEDKQHLRLELAKERVKETCLPLIYGHQVGGQDDLVFDGGSFALNATGDLITQLKFFAEDSALISKGRIENIPDRLNGIYQALLLGLRDYVQKNGFPGIILGLSGGIDSALSAKIAVDAIGQENVQCVMMPSPYTSQTSLDDAKKCAENLGVVYEIIPIIDMMEAAHKTLPDLSDIAQENIQSRMRGQILMALSNTNGKMVLSTGNKSEVAVGYATLYGDMCGGFNALKDIYKKDVFALCNWLNQDGEIIPQNILDKPPSAELKPDQKDEDSLPSYDILDGILKKLIEDDASIEECVEEGYDRNTVMQIWGLVDRSEYKRRQAAPGVRLTSKAFGKDRRYPITNKFFKIIKDRKD